MSNQSTPLSSGLVLDKLGLSALAYGYAVFMGAAYLLAFWRPFGFDVFSYLSLSDYVSAPLGRMSILLAAPLILAAIVFGESDWGSKHAPRVLQYLVFVYGVDVCKQAWQAFEVFQTAPFHFVNEKTILLFIPTLAIGSIWLTLRTIKSPRLAPAILSLILMQLALVLGAGHNDGKAVFNGASNVMFLDNKDLCQPDGIRDWVYVAHYSGHTFFMNTIEKRICVRETKDLMLRSRKFSEDL